MANTNDYKNGLPSEDADAAPDDILSREEADIAGVSSTPKMIYGEDSINPNAADQKDQFAGDEDDVV